MTMRTYTPKDAERDLRIRYCGVQQANSDFAFLFNDDEITGGSFAVMQDKFDANTVAEALIRLRVEFRKAEKEKTK